MARIPKEYLSKGVVMKRIICHWTAGGHKANSIDKSHYHFLFEGDGDIVRGDHTIADNGNTSDGDYAAHTLNCNQGSIGLSCCAMMDAEERPFKPGPAPLTEEQFESMCEAAAQLATYYAIPVDRTHVLFHSEVQSNLGIKQRGKWDMTVLPFDLSISKSQAGDYLRARVAAYQDGGVKPVTPFEKPQVIRITWDGQEYQGINEDGDTLIDIDAVGKARSWFLGETSSGKVHIAFTRDRSFEATVLPIGNKNYVPVRPLAEAAGFQVRYNPQTKTVQVFKVQQAEPKTELPLPSAAPRPEEVKREAVNATAPPRNQPPVDKPAPRLPKTTQDKVQ